MDGLACTVITSSVDSPGYKFVIHLNIVCLANVLWSQARLPDTSNELLLKAVCFVGKGSAHNLGRTKTAPVLRDFVCASAS